MGLVHRFPGPEARAAPPDPGLRVFGIAYVAHIPDTTSVWGVGQEPNDNRYVLAVYGRLL